MKQVQRSPTFVLVRRMGDSRRAGGAKPRVYRKARRRAIRSWAGDIDLYLAPFAPARGDPAFGLSWAYPPPRHCYRSGSPRTAAECWWTAVSYSAADMSGCRLRNPHHFWIQTGDEEGSRRAWAKPKRDGCVVSEGGCRGISVNLMLVRALIFYIYL